MNKYKLVICNLGYSSSIEKLDGKTSSSIKELLELVKEYIDESMNFFEGEEIMCKNFNIKDKDFNKNNIAYIVEMLDQESNIYIRKY
jgi:hypothetical protein